jgi:hypothetical protein
MRRINTTAATCILFMDCRKSGGAAASIDRRLRADLQHVAKLNHRGVFGISADPLVTQHARSH